MALRGGPELSRRLLVITLCCASESFKDDTSLVDADSDGYAVGGDCDDADATVNPGAFEQCNGIDDDCDDQVDEDAEDAPTWYADADIDGYGDAAEAMSACEAPANAGFDLDGAGDVDGDGVSEMLISAWGVDIGQDWLGAAYLMEGDYEGYVLLSDNVAKLIGQQHGAYNAYKVAFAGDVNGDHYEDILIGAPEYATGMFDSLVGRVYLFFGRGL